jgi:hypothetical protein
MIVVIPAPNNDDTPDATVDDDMVVVATVASTMSRNAVLLSSTWTAVRRTSLADVNPSFSPRPSSRNFPPRGGGPPCRGHLSPSLSWL